jgi:hypothetical protein
MRDWGGGPEISMGRIERHRNGRELHTGKFPLRFLGALTVVSAGLAAPSCYEYQHPGVYYCNETRNCVDIPTTYCDTDTNTCECPTTSDVWCPKHAKCMQRDVCLMVEGPVCDAGLGVGGGGGSGGGGGGG